MALAAMWFGALAPTVSHALWANDASAWAEVCTTQGARWVSLADDADGLPDPRQSPSAGVFEHCPYCTIGSTDWAPPPTLSASNPGPAGDAGPPERFLSAAHTAHAWRVAQPRAPPSHA